MFDYARLEDGRIIERIQQSDTFGQLRQLVGAPLLVGAGVGATIAMIGSTLRNAVRRGAQRSGSARHDAK